MTCTIYTTVKPRASYTVDRYSPLRYAVELGHFDGHPLDRVRWSAPKVTDAVDRRIGVTHDQAQRCSPR